MNSIPATGSLSSLLIRMWRHLSHRRRRQFVLLLGLMIVAAFADVASLGAVLPFLGILIAPAKVYGYPAVAHLAHGLGIDTAQQLVLPLTVVFVATAIVAGAIRTLTLWGMTRLSYACGAEFSAEVYRRTLYQPYSVHVARNSSEVISIITVKVLESVNALYLLLMLFSCLLSGVVVTAALIALDPVAAIVATCGFGGSYAIAMCVQRRRLQRNGQRIAYEHTHVVKAIQEGLGGIRDVLLDGTQPVYCEIYRNADQALRKAQGNNIFVAQSPRPIMETVGMVLIAGLAYGLSTRVGGVATALPVLGTLALGAQRLLPTLQLGYSSWAGVVSSHAAIADTLGMLDQPLPPHVSDPAPPALPFRDCARFAGVRFRYSQTSEWVLDGLDLTIRKGSRVGIVGATGSGKSTMLDLLTALLPPTEGELLVDGQPVTGSRIRAWQRAIAHVPQVIYLSDASLAENIAFGVPPAAIDLEKVRRAARQAHIADFIESRPEGYDAMVGERGVRLSGGQRQRIGIARALYKEASLLVFDEATSALDNATERSVMDAIEELDRDLTIVLIAHRLTTVRHCDTIVELDQGRVVAQGTYEQLLQSSATFRRMARAVV